MEKQLKVEDLPNEITAERLKFFFMNKKKFGSGVIENVDLCKELRSAVITFQDSDAVDGILERGRSFQFKDVTIRVSRLDDKNANTQNETSKDGKYAKNTKAEADKRTRQLKVDDLSDEITAERLKFFFMNKKKFGGGTIENVDLCKESRSAVITFQENNAVECILNKGKSFQINDKTVYVSSLKDESTDTQNATQEDSKCAKNTKSEADKITRQLKVDDLSDEITAERLKFFFMNKKKFGGGTIENVDLSKESRSAVITFQESNAVEHILKQGKSFQIKDKTVYVSSLKDESTDTQNVTQEDSKCAENAKSMEGIVNPVEASQSKEGKTSHVSGLGDENTDNQVETQGDNKNEEKPNAMEGIVNPVEASRSKEGKTSHVSGLGDENTDNQVETQGDNKNEEKPNAEVDTKECIKTRKLKVYGLPQNATEGRLKHFFGNTFRCGGGPVESVTFCEDSTSAIITFKDADSVGRVLSHGKQLEVNKTTVSVSALKEEDSEDEICDDTFGKDGEKSEGGASAGSDSSEDEDNSMHEEERKPDDIYDSDENESIDTGQPDMEDDSSEDEYHDPGIATGKPDSIDDSGKNMASGPHKRTKESDSMNNCGKSQNKQFGSVREPDKKIPVDDGDMKALNISGKHSPKTDESPSSDEQSFCILPLPERKEDSSRQKKDQFPLSQVDQKTEGKEKASHPYSDREDSIRCTVKVNIIDRTLQKYFYIFYLEDGYLSSLSYDEDSMILDGFNSCVYITFHDKKDALAMCEYNHKDDKDSNIESVEMATDTDLQFYPDLISLHGVDFTESDMKKKLSSFVTKKTEMCPVDIFLGEEPRSAIIKFPAEGLTFKTITDATWKCANELDGVLLTTAPIPKSKSLFVLNDLSADNKKLLRKYFSIKKRSGGGPCKVQQCDDRVKVIFDDASDQENVMRKGYHKMGDVELILEPFHFCLTKAAYKLENAAGVDSEEDPYAMLTDTDTEEMAVPESMSPKGQPENQARTLESYLDRTVKVDIINLTKPKDHYVFYFEDDIFGSLTFEDEIMILDGLNYCLYVTFSTKEDASTICQCNHKDVEDSNISSIEMASAETLQIYPDRISVHGLDFTVSGMKDKLCDFVKERTQIRPTDILFGEDSDSAIVMFPEEKLSIIAKATWKCANKLDDILLTTAPVPKSKSLCVSGEVDFATLKKYFSNRRRSGGGHCSVKKHRNGVKVDFENITDQENVLKQGNHKVGDVELTVTSFYECLSRNKNDDNDTKHPIEILNEEVNDDVTSAKKPENPLRSSEWENRLRSTVRVHVNDVTKSKDHYCLYFEEDTFSSFSFDEDTMILDGLNQCVYVTLSKKEDASALCKFSHEDEEGSNISSIEMARAEDLLFYSDMISVHGPDFTAAGMKEKLESFIQEKTKVLPADILFGEEPRSAIVKFASQDLFKISAATWQCAKQLDNVFVTTAPVPKSKSVFISEGSAKIGQDMFKRYFANKKRSGGGRCSVETYNNGTRVNFEKISDQENVLKQSNHRLSEVDLKVIPFYSSLSKAAYKHTPRVDRQSNLDKKQSPTKLNRTTYLDANPSPSLSPKGVPRSLKKTGNVKDERDIRHTVVDNADDQLPCTVKVNVIDVSRPKDDYEMYFEANNFSFSDEEPMILDGLNQCLYVTFPTQQDASDVCRFNHKNEEGSNISSIEIASDKDLLIYSDLISIHGLDFTAPGMRDQLCEFVEEKTTIKPANILFGEEPKSAIIVFPDQDIRDATWKCAKKLEGVLLITAPVCKTRSLVVSGDLTDVGIPSLKRYFSLHKRSGGGPCSVEHDESGVVITFKDIADQENVLKKDSHTINDVHLEVSSFHSCLSMETYSDKVTSKVQTKRRPEEKSPKPKVASQRSSEGPSSTSNRHDAQIGKNGKIDSAKPVKPDVPQSHEDLSPCAIKAKISDVTKPKQFYTLYFGSIEVKSFLEKDIILDALRGSLYVTFQNPKDAETVLQWDKDDLRDNNITNVKKVSAKDMQFYDNVISIHGIDFTKQGMKDRLKNFIEKKTGLKNFNDIYDAEPKSAIIHFHDAEMKGKTDNIYQLAWKCAAEMDNVRLITAPVPYYTTLLIVGDHSSIDIKTMTRYLSSKCEGEILNCEELQKDQFLVTFKDHQVCDRALNIGSFELFDKKLEAREYHTCLSPMAYQEFLKNLPFQLKETLSDQSVEPVLKHTKTIKLGKFKEFDAVVLSRTSLEKECSQKCPTAVVNIDTNNGEIVIQAETESNLKSLNTIIRVFKKGLKFESMNDLDINRHEQEYLSTPNAEKNFNSIFQRKQIGACLGKSKLYYYEEDFEEAKDVIQKSIYTKCKKLSRLQLGLLQSEKSRKFREELQKQAGYVLNISMEDGIRLCGLKEAAITCWHKIEQYLQDNHVEEEQVSIPREKIEFIKRFSSQGWEKLQADSQKWGASVELKDDGIVLKGPKDFTDKTKEFLEKWKNEIQCQEVDLNYNGIEEFLSSKDGQTKLDSVSRECKCLISLKGYNQKQVKKTVKSQPKLVGTCDVGSKNVNFYLGEPMFLSVDVIVVSAYDEDSILPSATEVRSNGGEDLREDFDQQYSSGNTLPGTIIETQGGDLPCTKVFHIVSKLDMDESERNQFVKKTLASCLNKADRSGYQKIALPLFGCEEFKLEPYLVAGYLRAVLTNSLSNCTNLNEVILCDTKTDNVIELMKKFDPVTMIEKLTPTKKPRTKTGKTIQFGGVTLTVKEGDLLKENCDAIACGIKGDGNLSHSGGVAKAILSKCGDGIQKECSDQVSDLTEKGAILTSAPNLTFSSVIHVNMSKYSRRWSHGVSTVLFMAEGNDCKSLALPAFGAGSKGADAERVKDYIVNGIKYFSSKGPKKLLDIRLIITSHSLLNAFLDQESDSEKTEDTPSPSGKALSSKATVILYADKVEKRQGASKKLKEELSQAHTVQSYKNKSIELLRGQQKKELIERGAQLQIKVKVSDGHLEMSGFKSERFLDIVKCLTEMTDKAKDKKQEEYLKNVTPVHIWSYMREEQWKKFDQALNVKIEAAYNQKFKEFQLSDSRGHKYIIDFEEMKEYTSQDGKTKGKELCQVKRGDIRAGGRQPKRWERMGQDENLKIVDVQSGSKEFQAVEKNFRDGGATATIKKIERIQNKGLYQQYIAKKSAMDKQNPKGHENERRLFHGTDSTTLTLINENGFNRSYCGKNATAYGDGVYFAVNSSYSVNYARPDGQGDKRMYQCRVLVGESTPSQSGMKFLPNKPGTNTPYDSGSASNIFIIFHDSQAYPEYIITF